MNLGPRLIDSGVLDSDNNTIGNLEFASVMGPVTLQSEAYLTHVHMLSGDSEWLHGGYAHLSYFLTGEHRIYERFGQHGAQFGRNARSATSSEPQLGSASEPGKRRPAGRT